ncbi:lectin [Lysobacter xanthus]
MKPIALLTVLVAVTACARPEAASDAPTASGADAAASTPATPAPTAAPATDAAPSATPSTAGEPRGIAVGEPHPSGNAPIDAGPARFDGYGDLRLGMSEAEARAAWKGTLQGDPIKPDNCAYLRPAGTAAGPYLMFEKGRFVRYDVRSTNTDAPGGGRVGLAADDIRRLYAGRVKESPHEYVAGGKNLRIVDTAASDRALLFEVDEHGRVTAWRVGRAPQVDYSEGCS